MSNECLSRVTSGRASLTAQHMGPSNLPHLRIKCHQVIQFKRKFPSQLWPLKGRKKRRLQETIQPLPNSRHCYDVSSVVMDTSTPNPNEKNYSTTSIKKSPQTQNHHFNLIKKNPTQSCRNLNNNNKKKNKQKNAKYQIKKINKLRKTEVAGWKQETGSAALPL